MKNSFYSGFLAAVLFSAMVMASTGVLAQPPVELPPQASGPVPVHVLRWLPDAGALASGARALKEYLGLWVYRWRGWA